MSDVALRASLRLWRWRLHRHEAKLKAGRTRAEKTRLAALVAVDHAKIDRRLRQLKALKPHVGHALWMPNAVRRDRTFGGWQVDCPPRGVLHTTEGSGDATSTLDASGDWPHFEVMQDGTVVQYLPMGTAAKALKHTTATPTNGAHAYQIEVCGFAAKPQWPAVQTKAVAGVMRFIETNGGVAREAHVTFTTGGGNRLNEKQWLGLTGWCGHQHVPENDHVDPGPVNIKALLA